MSDTREYRVVVNVGGSFEYTIEATDEESAEDIARERAKKEFEYNGLSDPTFEVDDVEELASDEEDDFSDDGEYYDEYEDNSNDEEDEL